MQRLVAKRHTLLPILGLLLMHSLRLTAQQKTLPTLSLKDLNGQWVAINQLPADDKLILLNFWATWCVPCKKELTNITALYQEWQKKYNVELIAISIDDARNLAKVKPTVEGSKWPYRVLLDPNGEMKRALGFQNVPFSVIADSAGRIVYQHTGYVEGAEYELEKVLARLRGLPER